MRRLTSPLLAPVLLVTGCGGAPDAPEAGAKRDSRDGHCRADLDRAGRRDSEFDADAGAKGDLRREARLTRFGAKPGAAPSRLAWSATWRRAAAPTRTSRTARVVR